MCTLVILRRPGHDWPLLLAANRDEMAGRPWRPPARHWDDRPEVVAGLDETGGGSWLGLNDHGLVAGILNRPHSLGPAEGKRSRGELVLEALDHADAAEAARALLHLEPRAYRPFNLVIADDRDAVWLRSDGDAIAAQEIPEGLSMITAHDLNDMTTPRIRDYLPRFQAAQTPEPDPAAPDGGDWRDWQRLLASRDHTPEAGPRGALTVVTDTPYGTVSSSLIALPRLAQPPRRPVWLFAAGRPGEAPFRPVKL